MHWRLWRLSNLPPVFAPTLQRPPFEPTGRSGPWGGGGGTKYIAELTCSLMPPLCEEGVMGNGNVLSQTMCLKRRTVLNACRWFGTFTKKSRSQRTCWLMGLLGLYSIAHVPVCISFISCGDHVALCCLCFCFLCSYSRNIFSCPAFMPHRKNQHSPRMHMVTYLHTCKPGLAFKNSLQMCQRYSSVCCSMPLQLLPWTPRSQHSWIIVAVFSRHWGIPLRLSSSQAGPALGTNLHTVSTSI